MATDSGDVFQFTIVLCQWLLDAVHAEVIGMDILRNGSGNRQVGKVTYAGEGRTIFCTIVETWVVTVLVAGNHVEFILSSLYIAYGEVVGVKTSQHIIRIGFAFKGCDIEDVCARITHEHDGSSLWNDFSAGVCLAF